MHTIQRQFIRISLGLLVAAPLIALALLAPTHVHAAGILGTSFSMPPNNLGLVGYWPFDGKYLSTTTATDVSGQGNNGTLVNGPKPAIGKIGQAINFFPNGSDANAYVSMGDPVSGALDFGTGDFSVGFWMKGAGFSAQGSGANVPVAKRSFNGTEKGYGFSFGSTNILSFIIYNGTAGYAASETVATTNGNLWHHYVGVRSSGTMYLYRDGIVRGTNATVSGDITTSYPLVVGTDGGADIQRNVNASIDDVRVYNRALSATEIARLYTQGSGNHISTSPSVTSGATSGLSSGLVGYWPFDGKYLTTTTATDVSGQGNNGTLANAPKPTIGKIGQALSFNGTSQKVSFGVTNIPIGAPVTLSAWVKFPLTGDKNIISRWGTPSTFASFNFLFSSTDCYAKYSASSEIARVSYSEPGAGWHLVTCVATSGNIPSVYVDGVLSATGGDGAFAGNSNMTEVSIGARNNAPSADVYTGGTIDDVRIYNRALSATEIAQLYTQGSGNHISTSPNVIGGATSGLSSGLIGYWPFDGKYLSTTTATDISGQGNNGTLVNGPNPAIGKIGQALSFNGTTQYVNVPDSPSIGVVGAMTITAWVKINNFAVYNSIAGKTGSASGNIPASYDFYLNLNTGIPTLSRGSGGSGGASTSYYFTSGTTAPATGVWQFIAVTDTGCNSGTVTHYLNGNQNGSGSLSFSDACANTANALRIGSRQDGTLHMNGQMDDVRIYNRVLSAAEILQLYKQGGGF